MCVLDIMTTPIVNKKYHRHFERAQPGLVGPVGDVFGSVKLKHSSPDLPLRYDPTFSGKQTPRIGSHIQDGMDGGGQPRTYDSAWNGGRDFKVVNGWTYQDLRVPDRRFEVNPVAQPRYSWYNKIAQVYKARVVGDMFLPLPGEYRLAPGEVPRGGSTPQISSDPSLANQSLAGKVNPGMNSVVNTSAYSKFNPHANPPVNPVYENQPGFGARHSDYIFPPPGQTQYPTKAPVGKQGKTTINA